MNRIGPTFERGPLCLGRKRFQNLHIHRLCFRKTPVVLAGAASAFQLFVINWFFTDPLSVSLQDGVLPALFGLSFALAVILWTEGTRQITAAESGLPGSAEVPLAIFMAWMFLAKVPPLTSLPGEAMVFCAVPSLALLWHIFFQRWIFRNVGSSLVEVCE